MHAVDPGFEQRTRDSFARQPANATLGLSMLSVEPGRIVLVMAQQQSLTQQHGFTHGGVIASGLDGACGYAAFSLMPPDVGVLTIEFKVNFLAPARGPQFRFEGVVVKRGRTISVVDARATQHDAEGGDSQLIATMSATIMTIHGRDSIKH
jgi:uncharacterized protein (TIGR00369 family)